MSKPASLETQVRRLTRELNYERKCRANWQLESSKWEAQARQRRETLVRLEFEVEEWKKRFDALLAQMPSKADA